MKNSTFIPDKKPYKLVWCIPFLIAMFAINPTHACSFSGTAPIHVDASATGNNNGTSWTDAFTDLQDALDAYCNGADIWVAAGTYKPSKDPFGNASPSDVRSKTFFLPDGIKIYGGFAGTETALSQRDIANNASILSGNIGAIASEIDNTYHVVLASADASTGVGVIIDGFSVTAGYAGDGSPVWVNGNIIFNSDGCGIHTLNGTNILSNNTIYNNTAGSGGGVYTINGTNILDNNTVHNNLASIGGGIVFRGGNNLLDNNSVYGNTAINSGGGVYTENSNTTLSNNFIHDNSGFEGAGIFTANGTNTLVNNIILNNSANYNGGGIYYLNGMNTLVNNTIYGNTANNYGGGIYAELGTHSLTNNIFWDNKRGANNNVVGADIDYSSSSLTIEYCITQENSFLSSGTGIINNQDPLFVDSTNVSGTDNILGTADDGLVLRNCSPAVNTGTIPSYITPTDILGNSRVGAYDMGAYENQSPGAIDDNSDLATTDATVSLSQTTNTFYANDCSSLIATVEQSGASPITGNVEVKIWFDPAVSQAGQPYVQRHIEITPSTNAAAATGTVTLYFTQAEFDAFNADPTSTLDLPTSDADATGIANLRITKYPGASSDGSGLPSSYTGTPILINPTDTDIVWNTIMSRWEISFDVTGFSGFFVHTGNTTLPVELADFKAREDGKTALLTWETVSEQNNKGFHIEHSNNGRDFETIGWVEGHGNTIVIQEYEFIHENPSTGLNYYRLVQEDFDGTISHSMIRTVLIDTDFAFAVYPNPSLLKGQSNIQFFSTDAQQVNVSVFEVSGTQIMSMNHDINEGNSTLSLPHDVLSSGMYIIFITHSNGIESVRMSIVE